MYITTEDQKYRYTVDFETDRFYNIENVLYLHHDRDEILVGFCKDTEGALTAVNNIYQLAEREYPGCMYTISICNIKDSVARQDKLMNLVREYPYSPEDDK